MKKRKNNSVVRRIGMGTIWMITTAAVLTALLTTCVWKEILPPTAMRIGAVVIGTVSVLAGSYPASGGSGVDRIIPAVCIFLIYLVLCGIGKATIFRGSPVQLTWTVLLQAAAAVSGAVRVNRRKIGRR